MTLVKRCLNFHLLIFIFLALVPLLFWDATYNLGGDDSKLYYLFPSEILENYDLNLYSRNAPGSLGSYTSLAYLTPFFLILSTLKKILPLMNTQNLVFGLNLSIGYLYFIFLYRELTERKNRVGQEAIGGLFYVFSNFTAYTLWKHQLFPLYLISSFPLALYLFTKAIKTNRIVYTVLTTLVVSLFSIVVMSLPWLLAVIICIFPVLLFLISKYKSKFFKHFVIFAILFLLLNSYWLFHYLFSVTSSMGGGSDLISTNITPEKTKEAASIMTDAVRGNSLLYPLFNQFNTSVQSPNIFLPILTIFPLIVFTSFLFSKTIRYSTVAIFFFWIFSLYFFVVKIFGDSGLSFFLWLNTHIKGFNMFRFMYDKFGYALALSSSLLLFSALGVLNQIRSRPRYVMAIALIFICLAINSKDFILDKQHALPIPSTASTYYSVTNLNSDYYDLVSYLKSSTDESKIAWLPLNTANYTPIRDAYDANHYFFGISPIMYLTEKSDLTGLMAFGQYQGQITTAAITGNMELMGSLFQKLNANYIIVNNDINTEIAKSYIYPGGIYEKQMRPENQEKLLGKKIMDFGGKYDIYEISEKYKSQRIDILDSGREEKVAITKESDYKYHVNFEVPKKDATLVLLEANSTHWKILNTQGVEIRLEKIDDKEYGNRWIIPANICDLTTCKTENGTNMTTITLYFLPEFYGRIVNLISISTLIFCLVFLAVSLVIYINKRYNRQVHV